MSEPNKNPGAGLWCTITLVGLTLGYLLGFGPACWLCSRGMLKPESVSTMYRPVLAFVPDGPLPRPIGWYAHLGAIPDTVFETRNGQISLDYIWMSDVLIYPGSITE